MQKKTAKRKAKAKKRTPAKVAKKSPAAKKSAAVKKSRMRPAALPKGKGFAAPVSPGEGLAATKDGGVRSLPPRQQDFVAAYLENDFNGTAAALAVGYSARTAASQASRLLRNVNIAAAIDKAKEKRLAKRELNAQRVLDELEKLALFDPRKLYREDGSMKSLHELDDVTAMGIKGFKFGKWGPDVKFVDKGINLERIGRHFQMFTDKVEHSGKVTLESLILGSDAAD